MRAISIHLFLLASGLVPASPIDLLGVRDTESGRRVPVGCWVYPGSNEKRDDVLVALAKRGVVLLGESHDEVEHHRWQLHTIAALFGHRPDMVLGFEIFPRRVQPVLDRWFKGELDETTFLHEVNWPQIWGIAAELYLPLFHFARMHRLPMLALNVDRATNRWVAARGFAFVPNTEREGVGDPVPASSFYRDRLFEWFKKHPAAGHDARPASEPFERFVRAQLFWDRAMAEAIASARRDGQRPLVIGIMGSGHVEYGDGVPHQLAALGVHDVTTALPWRADTDYPIHDPPIADVLFGVAPPFVTN
jgi:uncharacterized iron-regulated protein